MARRGAGRARVGPGAPARGVDGWLDGGQRRDSASGPSGVAGVVGPGDDVRDDPGQDGRGVDGACTFPACPTRFFVGCCGGSQAAPSSTTALPVAALISAGSTDFKLRTPMPKLFTDDQLRTLDIPVLALIAGRSVIHNAEPRGGTGAKSVAARSGRAVGRRIARDQRRVSRAKIAETAEAFWRRD